MDQIKEHLNVINDPDTSIEKKNISKKKLTRLLSQPKALFPSIFANFPVPFPSKHPHSDHQDNQPKPDK